MATYHAILFFKASIVLTLRTAQADCRLRLQLLGLVAGSGDFLQIDAEFPEAIRAVAFVKRSIEVLDSMPEFCQEPHPKSAKLVE